MILTKVEKISIRCLAIFILLFVLSLPFEYTLLDLNILTSLFEKFIKKLVPLVLEDTSGYTLKFYSDSTGLYFNIIVIFLLSLCAAFLWVCVEKRYHKIAFTDDAVFSFLYIGICYYLALQMAIYGFNKVFKFQFYDAHPNTLFTPVGYLTKDFLYWTAMGSSKLYNTMTGVVEICISLLLLFRKTRVLASLLGFFSMLYIFFINLAFDINVKIHSLFLVFLFLILLSPYIKVCYQFFIAKKTVQIRSRSLLFRKGKLYLVIKIMMIFFIYTEALYPYIQSNTFNGDTAIKPPFYGAYNIQNDSIYKRFFIHSDPYFIIQDKEDHLYSFPMKLDTKFLTLKFEENQAILTYASKDSIFSLEGDFFGHPLHIHATKINIKEMPLYKDSFEWTIDTYHKD